MKNYILIISTTPLHTEVSTWFYNPEKVKTKYCIMTESSNKLDSSQNPPVLNEDFAIKIIDSNENPTSILINNLEIDSISYNYSKYEITLHVNQGDRVYRQPLIYKRTNPIFQNDLIAALQKLSQISNETNIATMTTI